MRPIHNAAMDVFFQPLETPQGPVEIESQWLNTVADPSRPLIVFLHEGLGSLKQWRDFPAQLCEAAGCRGLVFSRPGYGRSTPRTEAWPQDYLQRQTRELLAPYFDALGLQDERLFLFGHSDGASLALLFAAYFPERVCGLVAMAPHLFVEPITIEGLQAAKKAYEEGPVLKRALARHHADTDSAFYGWNDAWLGPDFGRWNIEADLRSLACPVLAMQGVSDEYATLDQIHAVRRIWPATQLCELTECGHSPQRDQPERVIAETLAFLKQVG
jgi:pimeloyl-ACP methyl ester carboxylesterase